MRHFFKYTLTFLTLNLSLVIGYSQVAINENNNNPDPSAMLDVSSTDKGLLIPRMDSTARQNIAAPANGLMVYDISTATFWYYDNNKWNEIRNGSKAISYLDIMEDLPEEELDLSCTTEVEEVIEMYSLSDAVVSGHYLYGIERVSASRFRIIDISEPTDFELIADIEVPSSPTELVVVGQYAYVVHNNGTEEFSVIDISELANPTVSTILGFGNGKKEIAAAGNYLYVIDSQLELYFLNISNPSVPTIVDSIFVGLRPDDLAVEEGYAYILGEDVVLGDELRVVDINSVSNPSLVDSLTLGSSPRNIVTDNDYAYISDFTDEEIRIVDLADPTNLSTINTISLADRPREIAVANNYVFSTGLSGTFEIIDVSDPLNTNIKSTLSVVSAANILNIAGNNVIVGSSSAFNIIPITPCDPSYLAVNGFSGELYAVKDSAVFVSQNGITTSVNNEDDFVFGADSLNYGSGDENKFFFDRDRGAFRVGTINDDNWDDGNKGFYSFAAGLNTKAKGNNAVALGREVVANGYGETALGLYNTIHTPTGLNNEDRLLAVGNGESTSSRSDAFIIHRNGDARIFGSLILDNAFTFPSTDGSSGQFLQTDGSGNVSWASQQTFTDTDNQTIDKLNLNGTTLELSLEDDGESDQTVNLSSLQDDLGGHNATQNIELSNNWLSNDGGNEGIRIDDDGKVGIGRASAPGALLDIGDGSGSQNVLLKLNTERSWQFEQTGSGANTNLHLKSNNSGKNYNIVSSDGSAIVSYRAVSNGNNRVGINKFIGTNDNALEVNGNASKSTAGDWLANSDARLKKNIHALNSEQVLKQLLALQGITYEWNDDKTGNDRPEGMQYGFTAQNIQEVFPTLVSEDSKGYLQTSYGTYDAMYVEALRALNEQNENLKKRVEELEAQVARVNDLEAMLTNLNGMDRNRK
ncbi:MAG: tail fiber domain-containing protein [Bacteroidota bacterium]